jgi:hypothetical protein
MINWFDPRFDTLPSEGDMVGVLIAHKEEQYPIGYQIIFGEVEYSNDRESVRVSNADGLGSGDWCVYLTKRDGLYVDYAIKWAPMSEFNFKGT